MRVFIPKICFVAALAMLLGGLLALANDGVDAAVKRLSHVGLYALGGVGFAGTMTQGTLDFRLIMDQPEPVAEAAFAKLYESSNPQAKAYALTGMKRMNPERFKELLADAKNSTLKVQTGRGCILSTELLREIAEGLDRESPRN